MEAVVRSAFERIQGSVGALLINGEWEMPVSGRLASTYDPSTGQQIGEAAVAGTDDVDRAVRTAAEAQLRWARLELGARINALGGFFEHVVAEMDHLVAIDSVNAGLPLAGLSIDSGAIHEAFDQWPGMARSLRGEVLTGRSGLHYTDFAPYGVVVRIVAYNHPLLFAVAGTIPALLAGNAVVLKAAEQAPFSALALGDIIRETLPPGLFNIVTGDAGAGNALVTHPLVRRIAFTGSVPTGSRIQAAAARDSIRNVSLELGGKNAMIVLPDADPEVAAGEVVKAMNLRANGGQSCGSTSRLFVHRALVDDFVAHLVPRLDRLQLGPAYERSTEMGPMISPQAQSRIEGYLDDAVSRGAVILAGGQQNGRLPAAGSFVAPTLLGDVATDSPVAREEIFGPITALFSFSDEESMLHTVNDVPYGLTASIWTHDLDRAHSLATRVEAGYVWVNDSAAHYFGMPFGGWKDSGIGQEESVEQYRSFLRVKSVHIKTASP